MSGSWKSTFPPAHEPSGGWPLRPWDHRNIADEEGCVDRVAIDQAGMPVLDADGDEVQTGPGFDYEVAKVRRGRPKPDLDIIPITVDRLTPEMSNILARSAHMARVFGHSWVGTEHMALAVLEGSQAAVEIAGVPWQVLALAVAHEYEGDWAATRVSLVTDRLEGKWEPKPLPSESAPEPNGALRQVLQRAVDAAGADERLQAGLIDVTRELMAPLHVERPDGSTFLVPSLVAQLLSLSGRSE